MSVLIVVKETNYGRLKLLTVNSFIFHPVLQSNLNLNEIIVRGFD